MDKITIQIIFTKTYFFLKYSITDNFFLISKIISVLILKYDIWKWFNYVDCHYYPDHMGNKFSLNFG